MVFNSATFAIFFAIYFPLYIVCQGRARIWLTLAASNIFYAGWDWRFLGLIWLSTVINYVSGLRVRDDPRVLRLCIVANLGLLGLFKYFNFFVGSAVQLLNGLGFSAHQPTLEIILPIGISFYTFHCLSYVIDVHRGDMEPEPSFLNFATYVTLFPQLVAGPIVRARHLLPQIAKGPQITWDGLALGTEMALWGFVLKLCLADNAAPYVDAIFGAPELTTHVADALGVIAFALQIYGDFAGYSLIAIGIGRMMGFDFGRNFATPYFARSFGEFWQRWHISLSSWLRDYLFIPLGGSTGSRLKTFRNLVVTMFLGGLWHGASWVFVIWGLLHGVYLILERLVSPPLLVLSRVLRLPAWLSGTIAALAVFSLTCLAWIFFRAASLGEATSMVRRVLSFGDYEMTLGAIPQEFVLILVMTLMVAAVDGLGRSERITRWYRASVARRLVGAYAMLGVILLFGSFAGPRFIYFQF